jgi:hypothetical protein
MLVDSLECLKDADVGCCVLLEWDLQDNSHGGRLRYT